MTFPMKAASFAAVLLCTGSMSSFANDDVSSAIGFLNAGQQEKSVSETKSAAADGKSEKQASGHGRRALATARSGPAGTTVRQIASVSTSCLKPQLMRIVRGASDHFGSAAVITSGYRRSRSSYHGKCMAADVQIAGVSPGALARYFRSQPGVGGVGTYGHTRSVHVDVAPRVYTWYHGRRGRSAMLNDGGCPCCADKSQLSYRPSQSTDKVCRTVASNRTNIVLGAARV